jgi:hypothetical protein
MALSGEPAGTADFTVAIASMGNPPGLEKLDTTMKIGFIVTQQAALCQENFLTIYFFGFYYIIEKKGVSCVVARLAANTLQSELA